MRGLYAIIDPAACLGDPLVLAEAVLRGGCAALQLRDKLRDDVAFSVLGHALARACRERGVPFIVNDRFWLVEELQADGVHIGQDDAPLEQVRAALGGSRQIGLSTHSLAQACAAERRGADLIGFGPVFATQTKAGAAPVVGLAALSEVCSQVKLPVVAIGGLTQDNAAEIARSGASMGAVISALARAGDPACLAAALHRTFRTP